MLYSTDLPAVPFFVVPTSNPLNIRSFEALPGKFNNRDKFFFFLNQLNYLRGKTVFDVKKINQVFNNDYVPFSCIRKEKGNCWR